MPQMFVLPEEAELLKEQMEKEKGSFWIIKPPNLARGKGISVVDQFEKVPKTTQPICVQRYLMHPFLIDGRKFDLRVYVLVTSIDPLRIYVYEEGLARCISIHDDQDSFFFSIGLQRNFTQQNQIILGTISFTWQTTRSTEIRRTLNRTQIHTWQGWDFQKKKLCQKMVQGSKWTLSSLWKYLLENFGIQKTPIWDKGESWWNFPLSLTSPDYYHITQWLWCREFNSYGAPSLFLSQWKISLSRVFCLQKQHCKKSTNRWASITLYKTSPQAKRHKPSLLFTSLII